MPHPASGGNVGRSVQIIRLAYHGCTNRPFFHLVVMEKKLRRQELCIEQLGTYDPLPNVHGERLCALNLERLTYWIGKKAMLTRGSCKLLGLTGLLPIHPRTYIEGWEERSTMKAESESKGSEEKES